MEFKYVGPYDEVEVGPYAVLVVQDGIFETADPDLIAGLEGQANWEPQGEAEVSPPLPPPVDVPDAVSDPPADGSAPPAEPVEGSDPVDAVDTQEN